MEKSTARQLGHLMLKAVERKGKYTGRLRVELHYHVGDLLVLKEQVEREIRFSGMDESRHISYGKRQRI